ncbi:MAG: hypothetical protein ISS67_04050, partial [Desulfobacterales bacterium]|nr:hypothetical protein [Desulfobacterales bacterium]
DMVKGGQLVAVLDDDEYRQKVSQAAAEMEVARANLQERKSTRENEYTLTPFPSTLLLVPVVYALLERKKLKIETSGKSSGA